MDRTKSLSAYEVVNTYSYEDLVRIFYKYAEEKLYQKYVKYVHNYQISKI